MSKILITGGTGFLGRRLALTLRGGHEVTLAARNNRQNMVAEQLTGCRVLPLDVASIESLRDVVAEVRPDTIIHAAATKFVDLAERQPMECVDVNVVGSQNVARVAIERGVETVIGISTDKATPPVRNTYGLSKAIMERIFCGMNGKTATRFLCVRYGNVAWSTGSVLPIWKQMHARTGVIGTTGPDMTRFFFTVEEAVELVLTALQHAGALRGKVLSRAMKSALIRDVLELYVAERGGRWEQIAGRPGERNLEYLVGELELPHTTVVEYGGITHYVISFNERTLAPLGAPVCSQSAQRLTGPEIRAILESAPDEHLL
jgi:FlaA1/EpsC-like NDP-sugar epimerase